MKTCPEHRHEHRDLACPWPDCPNGENATDTFEVARHSGEGVPRTFQRTSWTCDKCDATGWAWLETGAEMRMDRCPHRRPATVRPRGNPRSAPK